MINRIRVKAYAKAMQNKKRNIEQIPEEYRAAVYSELISSCDWKIEMIDKQYKKEARDYLK